MYEILDVIESLEDYRFYLEADRAALNIDSWWSAFLTHDVWRFERLLRRVEYWGITPTSPPSSCRSTALSTGASAVYRSASASRSR